MQTNCPAPPPSSQLESGSLNVNDGVDAIPHVGPLMTEQIQGRLAGVNTVRDLLLYFSNPARSAKEIEIELGRVLANPQRNVCNRTYVVSDVNQCAFNNVLNLLQFGHQRRGQFGIPDEVNIPAAASVRMRRRGVSSGVSANSVRFCGCQTTRMSCLGDQRERRCEWHTAAQTGLNRGVCTPRARRAISSGFRGRGNPWPEGLNNPPTSQFSRQGTRDGSQHTVVHGDVYVNRWRIPTGSIAARPVVRRQLRRSQRQASRARQRRIGERQAQRSARRPQRRGTRRSERIRERRRSAERRRAADNRQAQQSARQQRRRRQTPTAPRRSERIQARRRSERRRAAGNRQAQQSARQQRRRRQTPRVPARRSRRIRAMNRRSSTRRLSGGSLSDEALKLRKEIQRLEEDGVRRTGMRRRYNSLLL